MDITSIWTTTLWFIAIADTSVCLMEPYPACLLMQRAACLTLLSRNSCVIRINDTTVTVPLKDEHINCGEERNKLINAGNCIRTLSNISNYLGITKNYDPGYQCESQSCISPGAGGGMMFPMTSGGLCVMFLSGMLSGVFITFLIVFLYLKWKKTQPTKGDNTYVDLDISEIENEEQPPVEYTQRGSVAFVREIASVYYKDVDIEKEHRASTRSRIFSWASTKSPGKSIQERKSSINKITTSPSFSKHNFAYEHPVPEENIDTVDLDSPPDDGSTSDMQKMNSTSETDINVKETDKKMPKDQNTEC